MIFVIKLVKCHNKYCTVQVFINIKQGLCGTFNSNQKDDFLTPEGDIEQSIIPFANKWKTGEKCDDSPNKETPHPCEVNVHNKITAEKLCGKLKSQLFEGELKFVIFK